MFCAMMFSACEARVPAGSAPTATPIAARTSGGRSVDVRTMSCRTLSKKAGSIESFRRSARPVHVAQPNTTRQYNLQMAVRTERDPLGELDVPADAYYGVQTARAAANFAISGLRAP